MGELPELVNAVQLLLLPVSSDTVRVKSGEASNPEMVDALVGEQRRGRLSVSLPAPAASVTPKKLGGNLLHGAWVVVTFN